MDRGSIIFHCPESPCSRMFRSPFLAPLHFHDFSIETYAGLRPGFKGGGRKKHWREIAFP